MAEKGRNQRSCRAEYSACTKHETTVYNHQDLSTSAYSVGGSDDDREQQLQDDRFYKPTVYTEDLPQSSYTEDLPQSSYSKDLPQSSNSWYDVDQHHLYAPYGVGQHYSKSFLESPLSNDQSHGQYVPKDVYSWQSDSEDQDTVPTGYVKQSHDDEGIEQNYRAMGAVNLDDEVLSFDVDNQLCSKHAAEDYPFNFDAKLESGYIGRHDIPLPSRPTYGEKKAQPYRDINKDMEVETWRTILIEFVGTNGYATLLGLKDSGSNVGNMITMAAVKMLGLAHKIDTSRRSEKVNTGGGVVSIKGTIWLKARGNGKHSGALFKVWDPNYNTYHVIMGAEWCYDNDALRKNNGGYNPACELPTPHMNPIAWVDKESKDEAQRNNEKVKRLALEAAQAEHARKTRKSSAKERSKRQPRS